MNRGALSVVAALLIFGSASWGADLAGGGGGTNSVSVGLDQYVLKAGPIHIEGPRVGCAGITFNPDTGTLFVIRNHPASLCEITPDGKLKRKIDLDGFEDTEDVVYVGLSRFAIVEEKRRNLCLATIGTRMTSVNYARAEKILVEPVVAGKAGITGVAYDEASRRYLVAKARRPRRIHVVPAPHTLNASDGISEAWNAEASPRGCHDISAVYYHRGTGHVLILSSKSRCIVEVTPDGQEVGRLSLKKGSAGMPTDAPAPSGLTMDNAGALYICGKPELLFVFAKKKP